MIGTGRMGAALCGALAEAGYTVLAAGRGTAGAGLPVPHCNVSRAAGLADVVFLAVPSRVALEIAAEEGHRLVGKTVLDVTNPGFDRDGLAPGWQSAGEAIAAALPASAVVKAFNTIPAAQLTNAQVTSARFGPQRETASSLLVSLPIAGDQPPAKLVAAEFATRLGFGPIDAGGITASRQLEALAVLLQQIGHHQGWGTRLGFHVGPLQSAPPGVETSDQWAKKGSHR